MRRFFFFFFLSLFLAPAVYAKEYPALLRGIRPLGMGGAFTAVADDENAMFYNPAGLANQSLCIEVINLLTEFTEDSIDLYEDIEETDLDDTAEVVDLLRNYVGEYEQLRIALFPNVIWSRDEVGIGVAGLGQVNLTLEIHNPVWPQVETRLVMDYGVLAGVGIEMPIEDLKVGASLKVINRESFVETYTAVDIAAEDFEERIEDDLKSGTGLGIDIGIIYTEDYSLADVSFGGVVQNIPEMEMDEAEDIKTQVNLGIAVKPNLDSESVSVIFAFDYMDIGNRIGEDTDLPKRLHLGAEVNLYERLAFRVGFNQGYISAGFTLDLWILSLDFATYEEEVGFYTGQREDRRYVGQIAIGW
ncbi:MAG: conjugal transfer protein TraF [Thermodesulfobacteriota bacterium]|nr:conjugal transfer protein TraF [Thermodesulfobacteriota bacterium]